jgi:hypothetical protein
MDRNHLGHYAALAKGTECERYWEARTKMMDGWLRSLLITITTLMTTLVAQGNDEQSVYLPLEEEEEEDIDLVLTRCRMEHRSVKTFQVFSTIAYSRCHIYILTALNPVNLFLTKCLFFMSQSATVKSFPRISPNS